MQFSLLDYALNETGSTQHKRRNLTIETISYQTSPKNGNLSVNKQSEMQFYLEANAGNEQWVSLELFKSVVKKIDDKM